LIALVRMALRRPYTSAVAAFLIMLMGGLAGMKMIVDIFPIIDIPVVMVVWNYQGLSTEEVERRVVSITERSYSTTVEGIVKMESQSLPGVGIIKVYFQPGTNMGSAIAQMAANNNTILRQAPPGITPPSILPFNASNVPVIQLTMSSKTLSEQQIQDVALNTVRLRLLPIPGVSIPGPFGGKFRQITIDLDPVKLSAKGFAPQDVVTTLTQSNIIVPAGTARLGTSEYIVRLNASPNLLTQFNQMPIGIRNGVAVTLGDVARVNDGYGTQNSIVHVNGQRSVYLTILKHLDASTLFVVDATRDMMPELRAVVPEGIDINLDFDQSVFVRAAVQNVLHEAVISSILVSLMILFFLGSWRNTIIVSLSIPLSIFAGLAGLYLFGQSINLMTLGGLALAIGLLVDNATVTIENIHRNQALGKPLTVAILDGSAEVIQPLTVATLAICIVFCPVLLLQGPARFLFIPLALTVVLAMIASYVLSFSVVPAFTRYLQGKGAGGSLHGHPEPGRIGAAIERGFDSFKDSYGRGLERLLARRGFVLVCCLLVLVITGGAATTVGTDFFPTADVGLIKLHLRGPRGNRIEQTEKLVLQVENKIRQIIPPAELRTINDLIGTPGAFNLAYVRVDNVGAMDAEVTISLNSGHQPSGDYIKTLREQLPLAFPGLQIYFQNADIVSQVLNFGLNAPIDIQIQDVNFERAQVMGQQLLTELRKIPGIVDPHIAQVLDYPSLQIDVDRQRAARLGLTQRDVSNNLLTSLSSSSFVAPSYFLNPENGITYNVAVQTPIERFNTVDDIMSIAISTPNNQINPNPPATTLVDQPQAPVTRLADIAAVRPTTNYSSVSHSLIQRVINVDANIEGRDLGNTAKDIQAAIDRLKPDMPRTMHVDLRGQNEVMQSSFRDLGLGMILAIILVYTLMVVLFQSWVDPLIIMMAVPGALVGIVWMLMLSHTTFNVESLMGTIMAIGISVSNSILVVSFANELRVRENLTPLQAAIAAGKTRLRPVLMTAMAMIIGMIPMALGLGEAGEQNAPLGRAVVGGLIIATLATLFLVPIIYTLLRRNPPTLHELDRRFAIEAAGASGGTEPHA
jgi:multidrug efflux pump subunit AcrB